MEAARLAELRALIARHKYWDQIFAIVGLMAMFAGMITLTALFIDLLIDGV